MNVDCLFFHTNHGLVQPRNLDEINYYVAVITAELEQPWSLYQQIQARVCPEGEGKGGDYCIF